MTPEGNWNIGLKGFAWRAEAMARVERAPETIEMMDGKLFFSDEERLTRIALLLENVGVEAVVRLGDPAVWREAVARLPE